MVVLVSMNSVAEPDSVAMGLPQEFVVRTLREITYLEALESVGKMSLIAGAGISLTTALNSISGEEEALGVTVTAMLREANPWPSDAAIVIRVRPGFAGERIIARRFPAPANKIALSGMTDWSEELAARAN